MTNFRNTFLKRDPSKTPGRGAPIIALFYAGMFRLLIGFIFWYRSLVQKGPANIGPLKFPQSLLRSTLAAAVLCEPIEWTLLPVIGCAVVLLWEE